MQDDYLERVVESYQGEVFGEAIFRELVARTEDPDASYKWRVLQQLEAETKLRLRPLVAELGGDVTEDPEGDVKGKKLAEEWAALSWSAAMDKLADILPPYIRFFEKLEADSRAEDRELLAALTAHEKALAAFARLEQEGKGSESLTPVTDLLDEVPAR